MLETDAVPEIVPFQTRADLLEGVDALLERIAIATADYRNSSIFMHLQITHSGINGGSTFTEASDIRFKDLFPLTAMCQETFGLTGRTDAGKTTVCNEVLEGLFGKHTEGYGIIELTNALTVEDLTDIDLKKLQDVKGDSDTKLSDAMSAVRCLELPGLLVDELNRTHPKLVQVIIHILDRSGVPLKPGKFAPIGLLYNCRGVLKRYLCVYTSQNPIDYVGANPVDPAVDRRKITFYVDRHYPTLQDFVDIVDGDSSEVSVQDLAPRTETIIRIYESLDELIPVSAFATLLIHAMAGASICIRTRSGRFRKELQPSLCDGCHVRESGHPYCGRIGGLSEGLLKSTKRLSRGVAAIRAVRVLKKAQMDCSSGEHREIQQFLNSHATGDELFDEFKTQYLEDLAVQGEDVVAAYCLTAPNHVYIDPQWLKSRKEFENTEEYAFAEIASTTWTRLQERLRTHEALFTAIAEEDELPIHLQEELEALITEDDPAMLAVASAIARQPLSLRYREAFAGSSFSMGAIS